MNSAETIDVAFAVDSRVAMGLAVVVAGIRRHLRPGWGIRFHVIDVGLDDCTRRRIKSWSTANRVTLDIIDGRLLPISTLPTRGHLSIATYARLLLPEVLPSIRRVIFLDVDLTVVCDIADLWLTDMKGYPLAAVSDYDAGPMAKSSDFGYASHELAAPYDSTFNAGVLLINLDAWRELGMQEKLMSFVFRYAGKMTWCDQDALNVCFSGVYLPLPRKWNARSAFFRRPPHWGVEWDNLEPALKDPKLRGPAIYHFAGPYKPWNGGMRHPSIWAYSREAAKAGWLKWWQFPAFLLHAMIPPRMRKA